MTVLVDRASLDQLVMLGGAEFLRDAIDKFLTLAPGQIQELRLAYEQRDLSQFDHVVHRFKGSCYSLGATAMATICASLEQAGATDAIDDVLAMVDELEDLQALTRTELIKIARTGLPTSS